MFCERSKRGRVLRGKRGERGGERERRGDRGLEVKKAKIGRTISFCAGVKISTSITFCFSFDLMDLDYRE